MGWKNWWMRLSRNLMDLNWRLCFPALLRELRILIPHLPGWWVAADRTFPVTPSVASRACSVRCCGHLPDYPAGHIFIESILFISCLQRFTLRLNSGAPTMADEVSSILLTEPLPIFSLFERLIAVGWKELLYGGMKEDLMQCHCLLSSFFFFFLAAHNKVVPSMKKNICMCQVWLFLLIGINRPTSLCYHTGELIPGKMFFSFSAL